tara:strand:+ start:22 stop:231 length:210 start_codon:yes stop_codon:yes gene_type:complete
MNPDKIKEICKVLIINGRTDLADELIDYFDKDYTPPLKIKKDLLSDDEGSAEEEELQFSVDSEGFYSLK